MLKPFDIYQNIHFIGIGGIGISALARLFHHNKHNVSGTDSVESHNLDLLRINGIKVKIGHSAENLPQNTQLVIYTTAIDSNNPEFVAAIHRNLPILSYAQAIGKLTQGYETYSICGTHGKTTITGLLGHTLAICGLNPTVIVGSIVPDFNNSNLLIGEPGGKLILESCEYKKAFLNYSPKIVLLNNIDPEHLDYYKNAENYIDAFRKFISKIPSNGLLIANGDDKNVKTLLNRQIVKCKTILFGRDRKNDVILKGKDVYIDKKPFLKLELQILGEHNLLNATGTIALCNYLGLMPEKIASAMNSFRGAARRLEMKGKINSTFLYDDYGHAPAEIQATLAALKSKHGENTKILCIFQPHQYSRTKILFDQFCNSFKDATTVFIPNIFCSRDNEEDIKSMNVDKLIAGINTIYPNLACNTENFEKTIEKIKSVINNFEIVITVGAGDIYKVSDEICYQYGLITHI